MSTSDEAFRNLLEKGLPLPKDATHVGLVKLRDANGNEQISVIVGKAGAPPLVGVPGEKRWQVLGSSIAPPSQLIQPGKPGLLRPKPVPVKVRQ